MLLSHWNYRLPVRDHGLDTDKLPSTSSIYRLCFLSDLHIGSISGLDKKVLGAIQGLRYDAIVLGGDHFEESLSEADCARFIDEFVDSAGAPVYAVFGNHDKPAHRRLFKQAGIHCLEDGPADLVNGTMPIGTCIRMHGARFSRAGLAALRNGPAPDPGAFNILVTHSPDFALAARGRGYDLYLCGHTHAGQICLPGGRIIYRGAQAPRRLCKGQWMLDDMAGYTSPGIGTSVLPIRINCPPEIAVITFRPKAKEGLNSGRSPGRTCWRTFASSAS